jgi:hypothetical protein
LLTLSEHVKRASVQTEVGGNACGLATVGRAELAEDVTDMIAGRAWAEKELCRDLLIRQALAEQVENFALAAGESDNWR